MANANDRGKRGCLFWIAAVVTVGLVGLLIAEEVSRARGGARLAAIEASRAEARSRDLHDARGKPLLEVVDATGAHTIYSVGIDGADDHGGGDDIAVKLPR